MGPRFKSDGIALESEQPCFFFMKDGHSFHLIKPFLELAFFNTLKQHVWLYTLCSNKPKRRVVCMSVVCCPVSKAVQLEVIGAGLVSA